MMCLLQACLPRFVQIPSTKSAPSLFRICSSLACLLIVYRHAHRLKCLFSSMTRSKKSISMRVHTCTFTKLRQKPSLYTLLFPVGQVNAQITITAICCLEVCANCTSLVEVYARFEVHCIMMSMQIICMDVDVCASGCICVSTRLCCIPWSVYLAVQRTK